MQQDVPSIGQLTSCLYELMGEVMTIKKRVKKRVCLPISTKIQSIVRCMFVLLCMQDHQEESDSSRFSPSPSPAPRVHVIIPIQHYNNSYRVTTLLTLLCTHFHTLCFVHVANSCILGDPGGEHVKIDGFNQRQVKCCHQMHHPWH